MPAIFELSYACLVLKTPGEGNGPTLYADSLLDLGHGAI